MERLSRYRLVNRGLTRRLSCASRPSSLLIVNHDRFQTQRREAGFLAGIGKGEICTVISKVKIITVAHH